MDIDNTLISSTEAHYMAWKHALENNGLSIPAEKVKEQFGKPTNVIARILCGGNHELGDKIAREKTDYLMENLKYAEEFPNVQKLLRVLSSSGRKICFASSNYNRIIQGFMKQFHWDEFSTQFVGIDDVENGKPDPAMVMEACKKLNLEPHDCIMIGDSIYDVQAGKAAGTKTIAVCTGHFSEKDFEKLEPDLILDNISLLIGLVEEQIPTITENSEMIKELSEKSILIEKMELKQSTINTYRVVGKHLGQNSFIVESPSAMEILTQPWMVGMELANAARNSSIDFLKVAYEVCPELRTVSFNTIAQIVPLAGSLYYRIAEAFESVFGESMNQCFVGAKRVFDNKMGKWVTRISYTSFGALYPNSVLIIGDTIATGGTILKIIRAAVTAPHASPVKAVIVYSIAGSIIGAIRLAKLSEELGIPIYTFFSNCFFGVESNGTDMPWLHPLSVMSDSTREKVLQVYGPELGRDWCSIWDWGERAKDPHRHLVALMERIHQNQIDPLFENSKDKLDYIYARAKKAALKRSERLKLL